MTIIPPVSYFVAGAADLDEQDEWRLALGFWYYFVVVIIFVPVMGITLLGCFAVWLLDLIDMRFIGDYQEILGWIKSVAVYGVFGLVGGICNVITLGIVAGVCVYWFQSTGSIDLESAFATVFYFGFDHTPDWMSHFAMWAIPTYVFFGIFWQTVGVCIPDSVIWY